MASEAIGRPAGTEGDIVWKTSGLGIDGVIIEKFTKEKIYGRGERDPPGGWRDFALDLKTGKLNNEL